MASRSGSSRIGLGAAVLVAAILVAAGVAAVWHGVGGGPQPPVLRVASQKGGTKSLMLAAHALDGATYRVEWSEFAAAQPLLEALGAHAVDLGVVGDAPFFFAFANGAEIHAVQAMRVAHPGASVAILVPKGSPIRSAADLRGRKVATGRGSIGHYLLLRVLERAGMAPEDVVVTFLNPADAKAAFASGAVDAWSTWGPYVPLVTLRDQGRILVDGADMLDGIGFTAATDAAVAGSRQVVADFLRRQAQAYRWALDHPAEYATALAGETGLEPDIAAATVAASGYEAVPIDHGVVEEEDRMLRTFLAAGIVKSTPDVAAALDPSFNGAVGP